ncbi:cytochrome c oxidase subunit 8A, mitochondrial [Phascolarctos cinereus]|uniref:Cytochrome c oxidase subunit 8 n=1 Tax=Phascolarctos cinereus TaxID=38626 RepID=A0A6P5M9G4_PHACI|nr:cytochrome c oxidase subunit 8A, mitochondrial [Phascolarctos cinereus]
MGLWPLLLFLPRELVAAPPRPCQASSPDAAMSALAPRLLSGLTRPACGLLRVRPAREELSLLYKAIAMTTSFVCLFLPAGWILSHLDSYKKKE